MKLRRHVPCAALLAFGFALCLQARADTVIESGTFQSDIGVYNYDFSVSSPPTYTYTFTTTSAASGGFLPALTLFNATTGVPLVPTPNYTGLGDVSISDILGSGSYVLELTEFPNEPEGDLGTGFTFSDPTVTGDLCGYSGVAFINNTTCSATPLGDNYTVDITSTAVTPEPPSWMLLLPPVALLMAFSRRRIA